MIYIRIAEVLNIKGGHFREAVVEKRQNSMREKNRKDCPVFKKSLFSFRAKNLTKQRKSVKVFSIFNPSQNHG